MMKNGVYFLLKILNNSDPLAKSAMIANFRVKDWEDIITVAMNHKVAPLLYHKIIGLKGLNTMPETMLEKLKEAYLYSMVKNLRMLKALENILDIFGRADIPVIVLKGAHLAETEYGNAALRTMADIDLLVKVNDLKRVDELLIKNGVRPDKYSRLVTEDGIEFNYLIPEGDIRLEIHWELISRDYHCNLDVNEIWERAVYQNNESGNRLVLSPEDLLIYICAHGATHIKKIGIKLLYDVAIITGFYREDIDWEVVGRNAEKYGCLRSLYIVTKITAEYLGGYFTEGCFEYILPESYDATMIDPVKEQLFYPGIEDEFNTITITGGQLLRFWETESFSGKISLMLKRFFPSRSEMSVKYPVKADSLKVFFFYPVRFIAIIKRDFLKIWNLLKRDKVALNVTNKSAEIKNLSSWLLSG